MKFASIRAGRTLLGFVVVASLVPATAHAHRQTPPYPRLAAYTAPIGGMTDAQIDTLARYSMVMVYDRPANIARLRARNPGVRLLLPWMPQNIINWGEDDTAWYADTTWSVARLCEYYARRNDWFLKDITGARIQQWDGWAANWTRYCPLGTYGTSRGLTYEQWLTRVVIPNMMGGNSAWPPFGRGSSAYNGILLDPFVDCVGSWDNPQYKIADPDGDGMAEGVDTTCTMGGAQDSLSILYREVNEDFHQSVSWMQDQGMFVLLNSGNDYMAPTWRSDVSGVKLEGWMSWYDLPYHNWWDWFYGVRDWTKHEVWGPGYRWAETLMSHTGVDSLEGWDATFLEVMPRPGLNDHECQRLKRWGLGTAMLGEGYFTYTLDQRGLFWQPEYDWTWGDPYGDYYKETYSPFNGPDTLYVRMFQQGFVEVNPNANVVHGVPPLDASFSFFPVVKEFATLYVGHNMVQANFATPGGGSSPVDGYELRFSPSPITPETWEGAQQYAGNPIQAGPDSLVSVNVAGLTPNTNWYFALRARVRGRLQPGFCASGSLGTGPDPRSEAEDLTPKAPARGHGSPSALDGDAGRLEVSLPNPLRPHERIRMRLPDSSPATARIYDVQGRLVQTLYEGPSGPRSVSAAWDGRTAGGAPARAGVYWLAVESGGQHVKRKVLFLP